MDLLESIKHPGRTFIIGEAGVNHNGKLDLAMKLVDKAKAAGVDAIKFQTFIADQLVTKKAPMADYQKRNTKGDKGQYEMIQRLQLDLKDFVGLKKYCDEKGIMFLSTPFDMPSVDALTPLVKYFKIPSGEMTNHPFLKYVAAKKKPMIISTGMATLGEIEEALVSIRSVDPGCKIFLLHCVSSYPSSYEDANLNAIATIRNAFKLPVGYSDHTEGIEVSLAAVAMGAVIIEKHFTLDKMMMGPDHKFSADPEELRRLVRSIRNIESAYGSGIKAPSKAEAKLAKVARRSLVANRDMAAGHIIRKEDIAIKRPGDGMSPKSFDHILGKRLIRPISKDEKFTWSHFMSED